MCAPVQSSLFIGLNASRILPVSGQSHEMDGQMDGQWVPEILSVLGAELW